MSEFNVQHTEKKRGNKVFMFERIGYFSLNNYDLLSRNSPYNSYWTGPQQPVHTK